MFINQLVGYIVGVLAAPDRGAKGQVVIKSLIIVGLMNLLLCEAFLGYAAFTALIEVCAYSVPLAAAVTGGMFLFQSVIFALGASYRQKKHVSSTIVTKEYEAVKKVVSAFLEGMRRK